MDIESLNRIVALCERCEDHSTFDEASTKSLLEKIHQCEQSLKELNSKPTPKLDFNRKR